MKNAIIKIPFSAQTKSKQQETRLNDMQKHLFWYPWLCVAMIIGILACIAAILYMIFFCRTAPQTLPSGASLVKEAMHYAAF